MSHAVRGGSVWLSAAYRGFPYVEPLIIKGLGDIGTCSRFVSGRFLYGIFIAVFGSASRFLFYDCVLPPYKV